MQKVTQKHHLFPTKSHLLSLGAHPLFVVVLIAMTGILGGLPPILMKTAYSRFTPMEVTFIRFFFAFYVLLGIGYYKKELHFTKKSIPFLFLSSLFFMGNIFFFAFGLEKSSALVSGVVYLFVPAIVLLLSSLLFKEQMNGKKIISILLGFTGCLLLVVKFPISVSLLFQGSVSGTLYLFAAITSWALYIVYCKKIHVHVTSLQILLANSCIAAIGAFTMLLKQKSFLFTNPFVVEPGVAISMLVVVLGNSVLFFFLYQYILKKTTPFVSTLVIYLSSLTTALLSIFFLHEKFTIVIAIGSLLILISSLLAFEKPTLASPEM